MIFRFGSEVIFRPISKLYKSLTGKNTMLGAMSLPSMGGFIAQSSISAHHMFKNEVSLTLGYEEV